MSKLIIYVTGSTLIFGFQRAEFHWSVKHQCYLYKNKEFDETEFNAEVERALKHPAWEDMKPLVKVVEFSPRAAETKEITVAEAEDVLEHLAPHRLKKKTGPKPEMADV